MTECCRNEAAIEERTKVKEVAQRVRALAALAGDTVHSQHPHAAHLLLLQRTQSTPSTHMVAHNHP